MTEIVNYIPTGIDFLDVTDDSGEVVSRVNLAHVAIVTPERLILNNGQEVIVEGRAKQESIRKWLNRKSLATAVLTCESVDSTSEPMVRWVDPG